MKNKGIIIVSIIALTIIVLLLCYLMVALITGKANFIRFNYKVSNELIKDEYFSSDFKNIKIDSDMSDIYVYTSDENRTRVVIHGDEDKTILQEQSDTLEIKSTTKKCIGICFNQKAAKIEVYLPKNYSNKLSIENRYGDIEIEDFSNATMDIKDNCGDISVGEGRIIKIDNDLGDVKLKNAAEADIKASAGDIKIEKIDKAFIKNSYGDIEIEYIKGSFEIEDNCGDVKLRKIDIDKNSYIRNDLGDIKIGETNEIYIDAKTSLGDVKIEKNYNKSDVTLKLENNCGDITVKN